MTTKRYEEFAYVLGFSSNAKSQTIKERKGPIIQAIGCERFTLLEILAVQGAHFAIGRKVSIAKENRLGIVSVLGKLKPNQLTSNARRALPQVMRSHVVNHLDLLSKDDRRSLVSV
ncbi:MAG: DUF655 domain-containing protein [Nitrososphaerales archaeon]